MPGGKLVLLLVVGGLVAGCASAPAEVPPVDPFGRPIQKESSYLDSARGLVLGTSLGVDTDYYAQAYGVSAAEMRRIVLEVVRGRDLNLQVTDPNAAIIQTSYLTYPGPDRGIYFINRGPSEERARFQIKIEDASEQLPGSLVNIRADVDRRSGPGSDWESTDASDMAVQKIQIIFQALAQRANPMGPGSGNR